ncbi:MAG: DUF5752 family protein [Candidatus Micrarchaeota archaeon]
MEDKIQVQEPIDDVSSMWTKMVAFFRDLFKDRSHRDLKRTYGSECARVMLREVNHPDLYFQLKNGVVLKSLCDLSDTLPHVDNETFLYHMREKQNDFSVWVRDVIGDATLANKLELLDDREDMGRAVGVRVDWFKRRL